jgi:UDP-GlcNAc:undecaprenyl-phosphate GlcNAc-1-phosphate transferase
LNASESLLAFLMGSLVAAATLRLLAPRAARLRLLDRPHGRKQHPHPVPMLGGIALTLGLATSLLWTAAATHLWPLLLFLAIGLLDDCGGKTMRAAVKGVATLAVLVFFQWSLDGELQGAPVLLAFLVLHSFNTSDNVNGLSGGIALVGALGLWIASTLGLTEGVAPLTCASLSGALLTFLVLNYPRGRVFLGDSGSLVLGGWFACIFLEQRHPALLLICALPLADLLTVAYLRWRAGGRPWRGDRRHVSHRLARIGCGESWAAAYLVLAQLPCTLGMLFLLPGPRQPGSWPWLVTLLALTVACAASLWVGNPGRAPRPPTDPSAR